MFEADELCGDRRRPHRRKLITRRRMGVVRLLGVS
jgi:hypothetical protein